MTQPRTKPTSSLSVVMAPFYCFVYCFIWFPHCFVDGAGFFSHGFVYGVGLFSFSCLWCRLDSFIVLFMEFGLFSRFCLCFLGVSIVWSMVLALCLIVVFIGWLCFHCFVYCLACFHWLALFYTRTVTHRHTQAKDTKNGTTRQTMKPKPNP